MSNKSAKIWWARATTQERKRRLALLKAGSRRKYCLSSGTIFGRWTIMQYHGPDGYTCRCVCGTVRVVRRQTLVTGESQSCGCWAIEIGRSRGQNQARTTNLRALFSMTYRRAARHRHTWCISFKGFRSLIFQPCHYCGVVGTNLKKAERKDGLGSFYYNGLDRVNYTKGYFATNVVPCCKVCNRAKSDMTLQDFQAWLEQLITYSTKK
jgi:hypothetical protein